MQHDTGPKFWFSFGNTILDAVNLECSEKSDTLTPYCQPQILIHSTEVHSYAKQAVHSVYLYHSLDNHIRLAYSHNGFAILIFSGHGYMAYLCLSAGATRRSVWQAQFEAIDLIAYLRFPVPFILSSYGW